MKRLAFATIAIGALIAAPAMAADLEVRPEPAYKAPPPIQVFNWTACFTGANAGGMLARKQWTDRTPGDVFLGQSFGSHDANSWLAGVQVGCDYQVVGTGWVFGIQGDYDWTDARGENVNALSTVTTDRTRIRALASATGRVGYAWNRFLGYVRGGGAWERDEYWATVIGLGTAYTARETRSGWTIRVGGEYAFTNVLSGFVEYGYYDFGTRQVGFTPQIVGLGPAFADIKETKSVVRAGLNFRFGGDAAPVGKY
jgi:outer membrane immunogenic protein